jgi:hypothetical protein
MAAIGYVRSLPALLRRQQEERVYRVYMTDVLYAVYNLNVRYADTLPNADRKPPPDPKESRARIMKKLAG